MNIEKPYLLFLGDVQDQLAAKTAQGVVDWRPEWCVGQLKLPGCRADCGVPDLTIAEACGKGARTMVVGVANAGGVLPDHWVSKIVEALNAGLNVASGLHKRLGAVSEIAEAARAIGVDRVAARFEGGLDHVVREGGSGLSAGERQLISIARALVADPRILILDEATSNIDRPSEVLIERAFDTLLRGRTSLIIAHRLATVRRADEIVVLEHGRIVQRGTYDELIGIDGAFRRLATTLEGADERRVA